MILIQLSLETNWEFHCQCFQENILQVWTLASYSLSNKLLSLKQHSSFMQSIRTTDRMQLHESFIIWGWSMERAAFNGIKWIREWKDRFCIFNWVSIFNFFYWHFCLFTILWSGLGEQRWAYLSKYGKIREEHAEFDSLPPSSGSWRSNSGLQSWKLTTLLVEPSPCFYSF